VKSGKGLEPIDIDVVDLEPMNVDVAEIDAFGALRHALNPSLDDLLRSNQFHGPPT
jgi:hypothetical protein